MIKWGETDKCIHSEGVVFLHVVMKEGFMTEISNREKGYVIPEEEYERQM
jgi:hypothetical protein